MRLALVVIGLLGTTTAFAAPGKRRAAAKRPAPTAQSTPAAQSAPATQPDPAAQPDPAPGSSSPAPSGQTPPATPDKLDARALMQSGLKLYAAKDFLGALAVFKTAYTRFASAKILLNIGTTLTKLDRKAEAANVYQRYLDSSDSDPTKHKEVRKVLAELDTAVAILEVSITPGDAELQIGDEEWGPAAGDMHRVAPGSVTVRARHPAYRSDEQVVSAAGGARLPIAIALVEIPPPPAPVAPAPVLPVDGGIRTTIAAPPPRSRIGVMAVAHIELSSRGGAGLFGVTIDVTRRLQAQAAAILGPVSGGYAGASFAILDGRLRPILSAGVPVFASNGARFAMRGAGGLEIGVGRHLALIAEVGVEHLFNPEPSIKRATQLVPAIGATGRL